MQTAEEAKRSETENEAPKTQFTTFRVNRERLRSCLDEIKELARLLKIDRTSTLRLGVRRTQPGEDESSTFGYVSTGDLGGDNTIEIRTHGYKPPHDPDPGTVEGWVEMDEKTARAAAELPEWTIAVTAAESEEGGVTWTAGVIQCGCFRANTDILRFTGPRKRPDEGSERGPRIEVFLGSLCGHLGPGALIGPGAWILGPSTEGDAGSWSTAEYAVAHDGRRYRGVLEALEGSDDRGTDDGAADDAPWAGYLPARVVEALAARKREAGDDVAVIGWNRDGTRGFVRIGGGTAELTWHCRPPAKAPVRGAREKVLEGGFTAALNTEHLRGAASLEKACGTAWRGEGGTLRINLHTGLAIGRHAFYDGGGDNDIDAVKTGADPVVVLRTEDILRWPRKNWRGEPMRCEIALPRRPGSGLYPPGTPVELRSGGRAHRVLTTRTA